MAEFNANARMDFTISITLTEKEARAVEALSTYGVDAFIKNFYNHLGESYMKEHEQGLRGFLSSAGKIKGQLSRIDYTKKVFSGEYVAERQPIKLD